MKKTIILTCYFIASTFSLFAQLDPLPGDPLPGDPGVEVPLDLPIALGVLGFSGFASVMFLRKRKKKNNNKNNNLKKYEKNNYSTL